MSNSIFGKRIQNNKKQGDIQLATNERTRNRLTYSVNLKGSKYISDLFQIFEMKKTEYEFAIICCRISFRS